MSLSLNRTASKLRMISEQALEAWSMSLSGVVNDELIKFFKQRVRNIISRLDSNFIADLNWDEPNLLGDNPYRYIESLDETTCRLLKNELSKAFKEKIHLSKFNLHDQFEANDQVDFLLSVLEDSIAADFMSALFKRSEKLEAEKIYIRKTLHDTTQLIEREGQRLAFDLHDGPAQAISSALLQADILEDLVSSTEAKRELKSLKHILGQSLQELRTSIYYLKPHSLSKKGLVEKINGYIKQFSARTGIEIDLIVIPKEKEIPEVVQINAFRIIQEALTNVHKHAKTGHVVIGLTFTEDNIFCAVEDGGVGFDATTSGGYMGEFNGYGLVSMRDRVEQFSGTFEIDTVVGRGTRISFTIPL